jgi:hypothetical protein
MHQPRGALDAAAGVLEESAAAGQGWLRWLALLTAVALSGCGGGEEASQSVDRSASPARTQEARAALSSLAPIEATQAAPNVSPTEFFDWAEKVYPSYFPSHQTDRTLNPYVYRYYPESGNYLGLNGASIVVLGPITNGAIVEVGKLPSFACLVKPAACGQKVTVTRVDSNFYFSSASKLLLRTKFCYEYVYSDNAELTMTGSTGVFDGKLKFSNGETCDVSGAYAPSTMRPGNYSATLTREESDFYMDGTGLVVWTQFCYQYLYYDRAVLQLTYGGGSGYASGGKIGSVAFSNKAACNLLGVFSLAKLV